MSIVNAIDYERDDVARPIRYKVRDPVWASSIDGEPSRLLERSYTPTLTDAKRWSDTPEKFIFVLDLLGLSLTDDGDAYVGGKVEAVEVAFDLLLDLHILNAEPQH
jgi:hypothetical protein